MNLLELSSPAFTKVIAATVPASILALIVIVLQAALRHRLGPGWRFALWIPVLLRLLVPVFPESPLSIFNAPGWFHASNLPPRPNKAEPNDVISAKTDFVLPSIPPQ